MADDETRWTVTHTKHKTQKRKVYQDGFLELQSSTHKVKLYDDCDKLLESKIVKLDDAVRPGETITFGAYLVDIGDPDGETKPIPNPILQRDKVMADRKGALNNKTNMACHMCRNIADRLILLRFHSYKQLVLAVALMLNSLISEFKKREVNIYRSSPPSRPDPVKDDSAEWQVLYTTQLTQKAKKFHDGILKVTVSGLRGRQVVLYDETKRLLDSRFLKNDDTINAGDTMRFDGHIVDIVELKDNKPLKNTNVDECTGYKQNTVQSNIQTDMKEWDVMYTAQVTQKAKRFQDGVLKLMSSGSQGRQEATLLAEDGTQLSHRYLKLLEDITSGSSFNMTGYLVEVGELRKNSVEKCPRQASTLENETPASRIIDVDNIKLCKRIQATRPLSEVKPPKGAFLLQDTEQKVRKSAADAVISTTISKSKSVRDAHSILSILKKPRTQEGISVEKVHLKAEQEETRMSSEAKSTSNSNELAKEAKDQSNTEELS
ncbi:uncharacterized protein LOC143554802 [Bidens hawaiensis]|uniref:uncharacterized protein LOC143554802 n=1 Tax=Bidens hawaiensis TaxID=980011 RepID=UPI00404AB780